MDNQHKLIKGYRDLSKDEIDLMNRIKAKGRELLELQAELLRTLKAQEASKQQALLEGAMNGRFEQAKADLDSFHAAEPFRWANIGKTDIQQGVMALVRAVGQSAGDV